jgi:cobalamin biosynthesis protein CobD/CbiB
MFTILAMLLAGGVALWAQRSYRKETTRLKAFDPTNAFSAQRIRESIVFMRQDSILIVGLLAANLLMLGIIADRMH